VFDRFDLEEFAALPGCGFDLLSLIDCAPLKSPTAGDDLLYAA